MSNNKRLHVLLYVPPYVEYVHNHLYISTRSRDLRLPLSLSLRGELKKRGFVILMDGQCGSVVQTLVGRGA